MKVKDNKATATLTDVKNKIGDVFSLVDKHGEVTITSYNKPAYIITKHVEPKQEEKEDEQEKIEEAPRTAVEMSETETVQEPEKHPTPKPVELESYPTVEEPKPVLPVPVPVPVPVPEPELQSEPIAETPLENPRTKLTQHIEIPHERENEDVEPEAPVIGYEEVPVAPPPPAPKAETEQEVIAQILSQESEPVMPTVKHPGARLVEEEITILSGTTYGEMWNRANPKEKTWVANAKELL